jgi:hypothetical protein
MGRFIGAPAEKHVMSSRLFRAVVGVGIALGTVSAACLGVVGDPADGADASTGAPGTELPRTEAGSTAETARGKDVDAAADAPADAPKDVVILDAFCDAAWPTTKGSVPSAPTCGPVADCAEAGSAPYCARISTTSPVTCDPHPPVEVAWCVAGHWQCSGNGVPQEQCECWVGQPCSEGGRAGNKP